MKNQKSNKYLLSVILIIVLCFLFSCHKRTILDEDYSDFRRVIGPEGGVINFYEYNPEVSIPDVLVKMEFPKNALDSFVVFNMYEFYDDAVYHELYDLDRIAITQFLYFVPFYESYGYNEHTVNTPDYHLSIDFNIPVTVTYNVNNYLLGKSTFSYDAKLYKIKIPRLNEWGIEFDDNIWIKWNYQRYPDGYDDTDIFYLITGRWTEESDWGYGEVSLANWEEVDAFYYNGMEGTVRFNINNTDYIYVMAENWEL